MKLSIIKTETKEDKNKRPYKRVYVSTPTKVDGITLQAKESSFNAFEENYLGNQDFGWALEQGDKIIGEFVTRACEPYTIEGGKDEDDREVSSATVLAMPLAGQMEVSEQAIKRAFANAGHILDAAPEEAKAEVPNKEVKA